MTDESYPDFGRNNTNNDDDFSGAHNDEDAAVESEHPSYDAMYGAAKQRDDDYDLDTPDDPDRTVRSSIAPEAPAWINKTDEPVRTRLNTPKIASPRPANGTPAVPPPPSLIRESAARARSRRRRRKSGGEWAWVVIAGGMISVVGLISLVLLVVLGASGEDMDVLPTATSIADRPRPTPIDLTTNFTDVDLADQPLLTLDNGEEIVLQPWDGQGRLTVLLMGVDRRPGETGWAFRTDTMMVVSIDPDRGDIGILSIPRDLYVPLQGYAEPQRINTPMLLGESQESGYGPTLAMETVQWNLGIRINEFLIVDFNAFIGLVDAIGGIEVTTEYTINDRRYPSMNYGYDPFYLPAGTHELDGYDALRFARTRHGDSDIQRAERQQQTLFAIRDKILDLNQLPNLIFNAPSLFANLQDNINTSLSLEQMIELALYLRDIPGDNISTGVIDFSMARPYTTGSGAQVLIPVRERIGPLMVEVFGEDYGE